ncbi:CU044_5270 family protein [Nonomuraea sp. NPDC049141]|uniref:CU044_5270 family protein n=1 Tax=Nonomuraea sp. NPDC049141 TaxID=3155500 RepID=UPI0033F93D26
MDDYQAVRELLPAPPLSPEVERAGRERLAGAFAQERVRRGRRAAIWSTLGLGLAGAAAVVLLTATGVTLTPRPPATHGAVAPVNAKRILLAAATSVAATPDSGAWWGSKLVNGSVFYDPGHHYLLRQTKSVESWIPADPEARTWYRETYLGAVPASSQAAAAWRAAGAPTSWTYKKNPFGLIDNGGPPGIVRAARGEPWTFSSEDWDFRIVLAGKPLTRMNEVPETPEGLRALFSGVDDQEFVDNVVRLIVYAPVTSETRAAAYRLLASMPGVSAVGQETDTLGRTGQALEYQSAEYAFTEYAGGTRTRLVIDPATGMPLSIETRVTADGRLLEFSAIQESVWTDDNPLKEQK